MSEDRRLVFTVVRVTLLLLTAFVLGGGLILLATIVFDIRESGFYCLLQAWGGLVSLWPLLLLERRLHQKSNGRPRVALAAMASISLIVAPLGLLVFINELNGWVLHGALGAGWTASIGITLPELLLFLLLVRRHCLPFGEGISMGMAWASAAWIGVLVLPGAVLVLAASLVALVVLGIWRARLPSAGRRAFGAVVGVLLGSSYALVLFLTSSSWSGYF